MLYLAKPSFFETPCRIHFSTKSISRKKLREAWAWSKVTFEVSHPAQSWDLQTSAKWTSSGNTGLKEINHEMVFFITNHQELDCRKDTLCGDFLKTLGLLIFLTWVTLKASGIMDKTWRSNQSLDPKALKSRTINLSVILNCERGIQFDLQNWAKFDQFPSVDSCLESYTTIVFFEFVSYY